MTDAGLLAVIGYLEGAYRTTFKPNEVQVWRAQFDWILDDAVLLQAAREWVDLGQHFCPNAADLMPAAKRIHLARREQRESARRLEALRVLPGPSRLPARKPSEPLAEYLVRLNAEGIA